MARTFDRFRVFVCVCVRQEDEEDKQSLNSDSIPICLAVALALKFLLIFFGAMKMAKVCFASPFPHLTNALMQN